METGLLHTHNLLRWVVLLFGILALFTGLRGLSGRRAFTEGDKRTAFYFMLACDIQLLLGIALYFLRGWYKVWNAGPVGNIMKDSVLRFWAVEHLAMMIIAIILVHIGYAGTKGDRPHSGKFRRLFFTTLIALLLIAAAVPWPFRRQVGRPWFPGSAQSIAPAATINDTAR
jgi:hypothetical protein